MDITDTPAGAKIRRHCLLLWVIALFALAGAMVIGWLALRTPRGAGLLAALPNLLEKIPDDERRVGQIILDSYQEYRADARNWSAVYYGSLFFSAACAALSGLVIKLEFLKDESRKKDLAAVLAMLAALLITLTSVGNFQQRWSANRLAAAKMERLGYQFITSDRKADLAFFSSEIQTISYDRNEQIVSPSSGAPKPPNGGPAAATQ